MQTVGTAKQRLLELLQVVWRVLDSDPVLCCFF